METTRVDRGGKRKTAAGRGKTTTAAAGRRTGGAAQPTRPFVQKLMAAQSQAIRRELDDLLDQIDSQTNEIERSLTFESLGVYKELVRKFVSTVVNELYRVEEKISVSPSGRKKSMLLVKKIDQELDEMGEQFLHRQSNMIAFMSRLDEIRGLLLDLYT
jgi:uncharacterized protein